MRENVANLALLGAITGGLATALGFAGGWWWLFDLLAHFRLHLLFGLLVCAVILSALDRRVAAAAAGAAAIANFLVIAPVWFDEPAPVGDDPARLRVALFNVHIGNPRIADVAAYLAASDSDLIAVLEIDRSQLRILEAALPDYRAVSEPRPDSFGIALFSRLPGDAQIIELVPEGLPAIAATATFGGRIIDVLAIHPFPPVGGDGTARRDRLVAAAAAWVEARERPVVVIGDLNSTPFSRGFRLLRGDRLVSSQNGFGYQATWKQLGLGVPIDHILHTAELTTVNRQTGPWLGSDHRPVRAILGWRR
jgi:endonuclease/exonuclease/phosphatase (EEP) superfamily protein YafD